MDDLYFEMLETKHKKCEELIIYYKEEKQKLESKNDALNEKLGVGLDPLTSIQLYICKKFLHEVENELIKVEFDIKRYTSVD